MAPAARIRQNHGQAPGPYARPPAQPRSRSSTPPLQNATHALDSERSPLPTDARRLTRMVAMFWSSRSVLNADTELRRAIEDDREGPFRATVSQEQKLNLQLRDELHELEPDLFEMLRTRDGFFVRHVRENLNEGQSGAKAEDNSKVKNAIVSWRAWSPPLTGAPKSSRGLSHLQCARLLAPLHVNFDDPEAQRQFIECSNPPMVAKNWPRLLYEGENGSISKPSEGLLQGELLIQTAKAILRTPSSVLPSNSARPNAPRRGRKGIASKYGLTKVTPAFIAYVAVMTRFAVSSEEDFDDAGGTFNYIAFYNQIREYLEAPRFRRRAEVLIGWWNRTLFPDSLDTGDDSDAGESHGGTLALLDAELEGDQDSPAGEQ